MKRYLLTLLAMMTASFVAFSKEFEIEHQFSQHLWGIDMNRSCRLTYRTLEDIPDAVEICDLRNPTDGYGGIDRLEIPATVSYEGKEYCVVSIDVTLHAAEIFIPNTVRFIKKKLGDSGLKKVVINDAPIESLPDGIFQYNSNLSSVSFGSKCKFKTLPEFSFAWCDTLTEIILPDNITEIGNQAFRECGNLSSCKFSNNIQKIGDNAFIECKSLTELELPESLQEIGWRAFSSCTGLERVSMFPLAQPGSHIFSDCTNLKSVKISPMENKKNIEIGWDMFSNCSSLKEFDCPAENISYIYSGAFANCTSLESFSLAPMTYINGNPFTGCTSLEEITVKGYQENPNFYSVDGVLFSTQSGNSLIIYPAGKKDSDFIVPDEVNTIEYGAFEGNPHISHVALGKDVYHIGDNAFSGCTNLSSITNTCNLQSIGNRAFNGAINLEEIDLGDNLENIGYEAFRDARALKKIIGGKTVKTIGWQAFSGASSLQEFKGFNNLISVGDNVFENAVSLSEVSLPASLEEMGVMLFKGCRSLRQVTLPESLDHIPSGTFTGCSSLESVVLPSGCRYLGMSSFADCEKLSTPTLPQSIAVIGESAFSGCKSIDAISIPSDVKEIRPNTFRNCTSLSAIQLPENLEAIQRGALQGCTELAGIAFPKSINTIDERAFKNCDNLKEVVIPDAVKTLGQGAFEECSRLFSVNIGNGVSEIGAWAFTNCESLETVTLGTSLVTIGNEAFEGDLNIREIICLNPEPPEYSTGFPEEVMEKATVTVPEGSEDSYNSSFVWAPMVDGTDKLPETIVPVEVIQLEYNALTLDIGDKVLIESTVFPENATNSSVLWSSSDTDVATVSENGEITALKPGSALITASAGDGSDVKAECRINVVYDAADVIEIIFSDPEAGADIYRLDGSLVLRHCHKSDLDRLPSGCYIVRTTRNTYKLLLP